ncbi:hypothetical protein [Glutamicibacter sp. NPDC090743]|uniref:hypothetical protein n=1 Tax=Glutamicibacter sp. NPDC090743 TaxID=3364001 RepID=UPI00381445D9
MKQNREDVPYGHGGYVLPEFYGERLITISGRFISKSHLHQHEAMNALRGAIRPGEVKTMQVLGHGPDQWANVMLDRKIRVVPETDTYASFQISLRSPDPRIFGMARSVPASAGVAVMVENRGSAPAWPKIVVPGAVSSGGYTITGPGGEQYTVTASPSSSQTHYVDMWDGMLRVNSSMAAGAGLVGAAQTFTIPPGGKVPVTLSKGGRIELYDTYM